jgi:hypothetical protein
MHAMNITVHPADNTLRFSFIERSESTGAYPFPATIDIGEEGRLLGIEIDITDDHGAALLWPAEAAEIVSVDQSGETSYLAIESDSASGALTRSVPGTVSITTSADGLVEEVIVPRRGEGYEITYPSGNR